VKHCVRCGKEKPLSEFYKSSASRIVCVRGVWNAIEHVEHQPARHPSAVEQGEKQLVLAR
jgi:hypothetical protein